MQENRSRNSLLHLSLGFYRLLAMIQKQFAQVCPYASRWGYKLIVSLCAILYLMFIAEFADSIVDIEVYATFVELFL